MESLKIGDVKLKNRLFLAPMVDVTDLPYRLLCRKAGAGMAYTEMLNIGALLHENKKTLDLLKTCKEDKPLGIQITGRNVKEFEDVSKYLKSNWEYNLVDINCGCPSNRITGNESGSYLLKTPKKIGEMVKILKSNGFVTTAKIRLGFRKNNVMKVVSEIEKAGADAITVHARLANQGKSVKPEWKWLEKIKANARVPIIGNGGIVDGESTKRMLEICDGAMIAGAAIGDPMVFSRISSYLKTGKEKDFDYKRNLRLLKDYFKLAEKYNVVHVGRIKYIGGSFIKGFEGAAKKRAEFVKLKDFEELKSFVDALV